MTAPGTCDRWRDGAPCGEPGRRYINGTYCEPHAPGATADHCRHRVPWMLPCDDCDGTAEPAPPRLPTARRPPWPYGPHDPTAVPETVPVVTGNRWKGTLRTTEHPLPEALLRQRRQLNTEAHYAGQPGAPRRTP